MESKLQTNTIQFSRKKKLVIGRSVKLFITVLVFISLVITPTVQNRNQNENIMIQNSYPNESLMQNSIIQTQAFLPGWNNRIYHHIDGVGTEQINYQIKFVIHYGNGVNQGPDVYCNSTCNTNFTDIRFTKADGLTLLDHWKEEYNIGDSAIFWVEVDAIPTTGSDIFIYWGNVAANDTSNGELTFPFFDNFNDEIINTSKWIENEENSVYSEVRETDGNLEIIAKSPVTGTWFSANVISKTRYGPNIAFRHRSEYIHTGNDGNIYQYFGMRDESAGDSVVWVHRHQAPTDRASGYMPLTIDSFTSDGVHDLDRASSEMTPFEARWTAQQVEFVEADNVTKITLTNASYIPDNEIPIEFKINKGAGSDSRTEKVDWVLVRNYVYPEPQHGTLATSTETSTTSTTTTTTSTTETSTTSTTTTTTPSITPGFSFIAFTVLVLLTVTYRRKRKIL